jgi:hypothetical protein
MAEEDSEPANHGNGTPLPKMHFRSGRGGRCLPMIGGWLCGCRGKLDGTALNSTNLDGATSTAATAPT